MTKKNVLVVGQTPPPYHGQAIMIEKLLEGDYADIELHHIRMAFSHNVSEVGRFSFRKISELFKIVGQIILARLRHQAAVLYYPPSGSSTVPMLRDMAILLSTRWLFKAIIFHFHGSGWAHRYPELSPLMKWLFRRAYFYPDAGIEMGALGANDAKQLHARRIFIVPYGFEDVFSAAVQARPEDPSRPIQLLFVGTLRESKGVNVLLEACKLLRARGHAVHASLMGKFISPEYEEAVRAYIHDNDLDEAITFLGVLSGEAKHQAFAEADLFCFPTFYESEAFSVVLVEALSFGLPIVTTRWRALPELVGEDEACGFLVPPHDPEAVCEKVAHLIRHPNLRREMAVRCRQRYLDKYTLTKYHENLNAVFAAMLDGKP